MYLSLLLRVVLDLICEVKHGWAEFLGAIESFQQGHTELLRVRVGIVLGLVREGLDLVEGGLGLDEALDPCRSVAAHHFIGLGHLHSWQEKGWRQFMIMDWIQRGDDRRSLQIFKDRMNRKLTAAVCEGAIQLWRLQSEADNRKSFTVDVTWNLIILITCYIILSYSALTHKIPKTLHTHMSLPVFSTWGH